MVWFVRWYRFPFFSDNPMSIIVDPYKERGQEPTEEMRSLKSGLGKVTWSFPIGVCPRSREVPFVVLWYCFLVLPKTIPQRQFCLCQLPCFPATAARLSAHLVKVMYLFTNPKRALFHPTIKWRCPGPNPKTTRTGFFVGLFGYSVSQIQPTMFPPSSFFFDVMVSIALMKTSATMAWSRMPGRRVDGETSFERFHVVQPRKKRNGGNGFLLEKFNMFD